jgi:hypothetical protein
MKTTRAGIWPDGSRPAKDNQDSRSEDEPIPIVITDQIVRQKEQINQLERELNEWKKVSEEWQHSLIVLVMERQRVLMITTPSKQRSERRKTKTKSLNWL